MIQIDPRSRIPIYKQIIESIKELVIKEVLQPGEKLPSVRELAKTMTINPNTIQKSYQELERMGIIYTLQGKGTFVSEEIEIDNKRKKISALEEKIRSLIIQSKYLQLSKQEFFQLIEDQYSLL